MSKVKKRNYPIVWNFMPDKAGNHFELEEIEAELIGDKWRCICAPRDVWIEPSGFMNIFPQGREERKKRYNLLLERGCRITIPGTVHRDIVWYVPDSSTKYPQGILNTEIGQGLAIISDLKAKQYNIQKVLTRRGMTMKQAALSAVSGRYDKHLFQDIKDQVRDMMLKVQGEKRIEPKKEPPER